MEFVQPIRDPKQISNIAKILRASSERNHLLFILGINTGFRISDLLKFRLGDLLNDKGKVREYLDTRERKTGKYRHVKLSKVVQKAIEDYLATVSDKSPDRYVFASREGDNVPIDRSQAYRIINEAARAVGITDKIGTHTLRKTFGYHAYKAGNDLTLIQALLNHASPDITLRYIGITQEDMDDVVFNLNLGG
jgi:integrase